MRPSSLRQAGLTAIAGGRALVSGTTPITFGDDGALQVLGIQQFGSLAQVTLFNPGQAQLSGNVVIEVMAHGERTVAHVPFTVWGGQKIFVSWSSPLAGGRVIQVGIIVDDGAPI